MRKFQIAGDNFVSNPNWENFDQTSEFSGLADLIEQQNAIVDEEPAELRSPEFEAEEDDFNYNEPVDPTETEEYQMLQSQYDELQGQFEAVQQQTDDNFMDWLFENKQENQPINRNNLNTNFQNYTGSLERAGVRATGLDAAIVAKESGGNYKAFNSAGGGQGAVGKYQFRWNLYKDKIAAVTGITKKEDFLNSPNAQEEFYGWYKKNELLPAAQRVARFNNKGLSQEQLARLVHFRGEAGAGKYLRGEMPDKPEAYNSSISSYVGLKAKGGYNGNENDAVPEFAHAISAWNKSNGNKNSEAYKSYLDSKNMIGLHYGTESMTELDHITNGLNQSSIQNIAKRGMGTSNPYVKRFYTALNENPELMDSYTYAFNLPNTSTEKFQKGGKYKVK